MPRTRIAAAIAAVLLLASPAVARQTQHGNTPIAAPSGPDGRWVAPATQKQAAPSHSRHRQARAGRKDRRQAVRTEQASPTPALAADSAIAGETKFQIAPRETKPGVVASRHGVKTRVSTAATKPFQCVIDGLEASGYRIKAMGGYRKHGSVPGSVHPIGAALDINQDDRDVTTPPMNRATASRVAATCGVISGGDWHSDRRGPDLGHFQLRGVRIARKRHRGPTRLAWRR